MLNGIIVYLTERTEVGVDGFNRPIYAEREVAVNDVLVAPASTTDIPATLDLTGKKAIYTLAIPKGDTHNWTDCTVRFFGDVWHSVGFPLEGIEDMIPLRWNKKVLVERYYGQ